MTKIDKQLVEAIKWEDDPDHFDERLCALGQDHNEFFVVNPKYDPWILDYVDVDEFKSSSCVVWAIDNLWLVKKFKRSWQPSHGWKLIHCELELEKNISYNPEVKFVNSELRKYFDSYKITIDQAHNEHIWYTDDWVWVAKVSASEFNITGSVDMGKIGPMLTYNTDIPDTKFEVNVDLPYYHNDYDYELVWYLDYNIDGNDVKIWVAKFTPDIVQGVKDMGTIRPEFNFDVVFISYNEPNAEANWQRVLEICPTAKRVKNVKGIFEAHKAAAELATTDMFYVVDGDAELVDNWRFNYQPDVFDLNCVHLWTSINPINDLEYGWGGVKLFPRQLLLDATTWKVDLTTGLGKLVYLNKISNVNTFNTDAFNTWRSAFRECAKLSANIMTGFKTDAEREDAEHRLRVWNTVGADRLYGNYALSGAKVGTEFGFANFDELDRLKLINDYEWMKNEFDKFYKQQ